MKRRQSTPWIWGFCWAMVPAALTAMVMGLYIEPTHAMAQANERKEGVSLSALRTSDALRADIKVLDTGQLVQGDEVHAQVQIRNVWRRTLSLDVALVHLPGWTATAESETLEPGESTVLHLRGTAAEPGDFSGAVRITALDDFLSLRVKVKGQVVPKPEPPITPPEPDAEAQQPGAGEAPRAESPVQVEADAGQGSAGGSQATDGGNQG